MSEELENYFLGKTGIPAFAYFDDGKNEYLRPVRWMGVEMMEIPRLGYTPVLKFKRLRLEEKERRAHE